MKSEELRALGLDKSTIKKVQRIHAEDVKKLHQRLNPNYKEKINQHKDAIHRVVALIEELDSLRQILDTVTHYCHKELLAAKEVEKAQKRGENMAYYTECPICGDNLDPGEKCNCQNGTETALEENQERENREKMQKMKNDRLTDSNC